MSLRFAMILGVVLTVISIVLLYLFVLPKKQNGKLPPFLQRLHDFFHFKKLFLEPILKFLYLLSTCFCIFFGLFLLFGRVEYISHPFLSTYSSYSESTFLRGLVLLVAGPIVLRILYEGAMLLILAARNLVEINQKFGAAPGTADATSSTQKPDAETSSTSAETPTLYCSQCGTAYDKSDGVCPHCGKT